MCLIRDKKKKCTNDGDLENYFWSSLEYRVGALANTSLCGKVLLVFVDKTSLMGCHLIEH